MNLNEDQLKPDWMILDGQQRLTSLHYVFAAPGIPLRWTRYPYLFFLDLRKVTEGDFENAISSERADYAQGRLDRQTQFETLIIPFTEIECWNDWLNAYEQWLVDRDRDAYFNQYFPIDKPAWNEAIERVRKFLVPTLEIPKIPSDDPDRIGEVCAIFEKMNSTGVRLSVYDLLTARLYRFTADDGRRIDLHRLWEEAMERHRLLKQFSGGQPDTYGVFALRTIALLRGLDVKSKTLINLSPMDFVKDLRRALRAMEKALQRLTSTNEDGFAVFDPKWMPYSTMISPLAALLDQIEQQQHDHHAYRLLRCWYWASVFRERYAGAVESTMYRDYQDMLEAFTDPDTQPEAIADARRAIVESESFSLRDIARVNAIYRGIMCLIAIRGAKDFQADDAIEFHTLDDHHVFPRAYLRKQQRPDGKTYSKDAINTIVNRTLISATTNRRISRRSPSNYLTHLVPADRMADIMDTHFVDATALNAMQSDDYERFLAAREKALIVEIRRRVTGAE